MRVYNYLVMAKARTPSNTPYRAINQIIFKLEYLNPTGSVKDRGVSKQIFKLHKQGVKSLVIASSGNAAISAAYYCQAYHLSLTAFISPNINPQKLAHLKNSSTQLMFSPRPVTDAFRYATKTHSYLLRPSVNPDGPIGYQTLGNELAKIKPAAIFFPVSSGVTLLGTTQGYSKVHSLLPQIHIVQTTAVHPLAQKFDHNFTSSKTSLADSLVAKSIPNKSKILNIINLSHGSGWVVSDEQISQASLWLDYHNLACSYEGAAALAAIWKAQKQGWYRPNSVVCLLTGKKY